jgi:hypothetical protein
MIEIREENKKLLVYQDDKLIAEDTSIRLTLITNNEYNGTGLRGINSTICQIVQSSNFYAEAMGHTRVSLDEENIQASIEQAVKLIVANCENKARKNIQEIANNFKPDQQ